MATKQTTVTAPESGEVPVIAASYERVSTLQQARFGYSLAAQHRSAEEFAAEQGWELPEHLRFRDGVDDNASGRDWDLPDLNKMLKAAREGEFSVLIVPDPDRFARTSAKAQALKDLLRTDYGIRVIYQILPMDDTPEGRLLERHLESFAEYELEKFRARSMTGRRQKALEGKVVGQSIPPFGYRYVYDDRDKPYQLEPDPVTGPIATEVFHAMLTMSCQDVANMLNERGITTPRGRRWTSRQIWRFAVQTAYVGEWRFASGDAYDQRIPLEDRHGIVVEVPALIDRETWNAVHDILARRKVVRRGRQPKEGDPYILRGLLTCGHCHGALSTDYVHGRRYYNCLRRKPYNAERLGKPVCDLPGVRGDTLEAELKRVISETLLDREYLAIGLEAARSEREESDQLRQDRLTALDREITRQRGRLDRLASRSLDADDELYAALRRQADEIEKLLKGLVAERSGLESVRGNGLSEAEALSIQHFAAQAAQSLEHATTADLRELYEHLQLQGTVYEDPNGIQINHRKRFRIDWRAAIPLRNSVTPLTRIGMPS